MSRQKNWLATCSGWTRSCSYFSFAIKRDTITVFAVIKIADGFPINYTRYVSAYYSDMTSLPDKHPEKWRIFSSVQQYIKKKFPLTRLLKQQSSTVQELERHPTLILRIPTRVTAPNSTSQWQVQEAKVLHRRPRRWQRARPQKLFCALIEIVCVDDHYCWKPQSTNARCVKVPRP